MGLYEEAVAAFRSGATGRADDLALELLRQARDDGDVAEHDSLQLRRSHVGPS